MYVNDIQICATMETSSSRGECFHCFQVNYSRSDQESIKCNTVNVQIYANMQISSKARTFSLADKANHKYSIFTSLCSFRH